ncbi:nitrite reductase (NAD(P)H) small subunit [Alkalicoccus daliensis]|uniref:Nitrite reductase (NADH) small subunit n=1 Tax=Alkalicoccus daliensis TaxID=745820 RepID=A0A1H0E3V0_9BACI|nr:nitrite reductase (NAD(P)H) small subunit [Alkalicoccus daliensis]SDN77114.1 nitrite reductase (NADH) small subunit [Alkalicoccus daliensis]
MNMTKSLIRVMPEKELIPFIGREVNVYGTSIALFRLSDGTIKAVGSRCPHTNGPLAEGIVSGEFVYCPLQNWKVSLTTGKVQAPDEGEVPTYETVIENGNIFVSI